MLAKQIMVINRTASLLELLEILLEDEGYAVDTFSDAAISLDDVKQNQPDLVILDQLFSDVLSGWQLIQKMRDDGSTRNIPIVICSSEVFELRKIKQELRQKNIIVIENPFDIDDFVTTVKEVFESAS